MLILDVECSVCQFFSYKHNVSRGRHELQQVKDPDIDSRETKVS